LSTIGGLCALQAMVLGPVLGLAFALRLSRVPRILLAGGTVLFFVVLTGGEPSMMRAALGGGTGGTRRATLNPTVLGVGTALRGSWRPVDAVIQSGPWLADLRRVLRSDRRTRSYPDLLRPRQDSMRFRTCPPAEQVGD
jgi:hypothetical protein